MGKHSLNFLLLRVGVGLELLVRLGPGATQPPATAAKMATLRLCALGRVNTARPRASPVIPPTIMTIAIPQRKLSTYKKRRATIMLSRIKMECCRVITRKKTLSGPSPRSPAIRVKETLT